MTDGTSAAVEPCGQVEVDEALLARPAISIRFRVVAVFGLLFALTATITVAAVVLVLQLRTKENFLEKVGDYAFEIDQARRFEKDFFLYGTNLPDAIAHIHSARSLLERNSRDLEAVVGGEMYERMRETVSSYQGNLELLLDTVASGGPDLGRKQDRIEVALRTDGAQAIADAHEMIARERTAVHSLLQTSIVSAVAGQGVMLLVMVVLAAFIIRSFVNPLERFRRYASRIGSGDYSPITPTRRYRDEFSQLAIAFNKMLCELKTHQDQLIQSGKMAAVGNLTSGIAHELNNPLNNIGLNVEALLDELDDYTDAEKRKLLEQIYTQVERASATVRDLLDFTRKGTPAFVSVAIAEIIESTSNLISNELTISGIDLEVELANGLPRITGNPRNLQQVFLNLFLNSIQAMPGGGRLSVGAGVQDGFVRVDVADTGVGIAPENLDKLFDPFFTTKEVGEGTGLGLSVCYGIIERHEGRITVGSQPGAGTTVSVFLPIAKT